MSSLKPQFFHAIILALALGLMSTNIYADACNKTPNGLVIFDNTATPDRSAITSNLVFHEGCSKKKTPIENNGTGNAINTAKFQVLRRDRSIPKNPLTITVGRSAGTVKNVSDNLVEPLQLFSAGKHLFNLDRLRAAANWMSGQTGGVDNITPDPTLTTGTYVGLAKPYGTMTFGDFVNHVSVGNTLYGIVRVMVGLKAPGLQAPDGSTYQFCDINGYKNSTYCQLLSCIPTTSLNINTEKSPVCNNIIKIDANSRIKVKGTLFFDFVDESDGLPVPLDKLPPNVKDLYFKITVPIMVNWAHDATGDGIMDSMNLIESISDPGSSDATIQTAVASASTAEQTLAPVISFSDIPAESKAAYFYQYRRTLDATEFETLGDADKYHLLMPSGYAGGWADAFNKLNITAADWQAQPQASYCPNPTACTGSDFSTFGIPADAVGSDPLSEDQIRSSSFEDIPSYLYSGGLVDMHGHVNISGLIYVPQAMELEAKKPTVRQYISGAIVVRDGFFIEADNATSGGSSITVISADPQSYSTAKLATKATNAVLSAESGGPASHATISGAPAAVKVKSGSPCVGCPSGGGGTSSSPLGSRLWMEIRPQVDPPKP